MALLTTAAVLPTGTTSTLAAATGGGDTFIPDNNAWLEVNNGSGAPITVTVVAFNGGLTTTEWGAAVPALAVSVAAGARVLIGPLKPGNYLNPATGVGNITYSGVTSLTVGIRRM